MSGIALKLAVSGDRAKSEKGSGYGRSSKKLLMADEINDVHPDVLGDLPQQKWLKVASGVKRNRGAAPVGMTILDVRTALADFHEAEVFEDAGNFAVSEPECSP
jgi:hypothetical protein